MRREDMSAEALEDELITDLHDSIAHLEAAAGKLCYVRDCAKGQPGHALYVRAAHQLVELSTALRLAHQEREDARSARSERERAWAGGVAVGDERKR